MRVIEHDEPHYRESKYEHDPELREAYECGRKEGWRQAMREAERESHYHERRDWRGIPPIHMREHDRDPYYDEPEYRRYRDARGRYY